MIITDNLQTDLLPGNNVNYSVILPPNCRKTLLWLHGYQERSNRLLQYEEFERLAERHHIAVIFPDTPDTYYINQEWNRCYTEKFLITEFIPQVTAKYQLPAGCNQIFLAGISMDGSDALCNHRVYVSYLSDLWYG